jgi:hypothetical protein
MQTALVFSMRSDAVDQVNSIHCLAHPVKFLIGYVLVRLTSSLDYNRFVRQSKSSRSLAAYKRDERSSLPLTADQVPEAQFEVPTGTEPNQPQSSGDFFSVSARVMRVGGEENLGAADIEFEAE